MRITGFPYELNIHDLLWINDNNIIKLTTFV